MAFAVLALAVTVLTLAVTVLSQPDGTNAEYDNAQNK
jgi:hypothetical protein